jgi:HK97 gp10 family phage protein
MIKVDTKGFQEFQKSVLNALEKSNSHLVSALKTAVTVVTLAAKNTVPVGATGELRRSIGSDIDERSLIGIVGLDFPGRNYGIYVEKGTRPHMPPIGALDRWANQRGLNPYAVAKSIARKGTKAQPFMKPAYEKNEKFIRRQFSEANEKIVRDMSHGH